MQLISLNSDQSSWITVSWKHTVKWNQVLLHSLHGNIRALLHPTFQDFSSFPGPRHFSMTFHAWRFYILNSRNVKDFPGFAKTTEATPCRKMSRSRDDNTYYNMAVTPRSNSHVHFHIGIPPFKIFNIIYHISPNTSRISNASWGLLLEEIRYLPANIQGGPKNRTVFL